MSENKQPQEFDFFQEALQAFDAPAVQEAPQPTAPIEKVPVPEVQAETPDFRPAKPTFWQRWWPAILCVAVCIALVISFFSTENCLLIVSPIGESRNAAISEVQILPLFNSIQFH